MKKMQGSFPLQQGAKGTSSVAEAEPKDSFEESKKVVRESNFMNGQVDRSTRFLSAALRHIRDAERLATPNEPFFSLDQAEHLAGFAPECARKALLDLTHLPSEVADAFDKLLGHDFGELAEQAIGLALALNPAARRFNVEGWGTRFPELKEWREECRYQVSGVAAARELREQTRRQPLWLQDKLLPAARTLVDEAAVALWIEGTVEAGAL